MEFKYGQLRIPIPFPLKLTRLTAALTEAGYQVRTESGETTSQGWGEDYDREGYYPYWVYEDDGIWFFAFSPEDYRPGIDSWQAYAGPEAQAELDRWWPYLEAARKV